MIKYLTYLNLLLFCCFITSCTHYPPELEEALRLAGSNRHEVEKVLKHYAKNPQDSSKYRAARFLIANMPGHYAFDTTELHLYDPVLYKMDSIRYYSVEERIALDREWDSLKRKFPLKKHVYRQQPDIEHITGDYLIRHIDAAMAAWQHHPYRDSIAFDDFFEYMLPYRKKQGASLEDWQSFFMSRHGSFLSEHYPLPVWVNVDSLFYRYRYFQNTNYVTDFPFLRVRDLLTSWHSVCYERCWFNTMLLSTVGIPSSIDYIPAWGNRNDNHFWNTILLKNKFYAIGTSWNDDLWKYNKLYDNIATDPLWGSFRIPKVYRQTYRRQNDPGPLSDAGVEEEDIPEFFRNPYQLDVSKDYFTVHDVEVNVNRIFDAAYCYLCVFNDNEWKPVQWGRYDGDKAVFRDMGCGMVYLPAFYRGKKIYPAGDPFILNVDGSMTSLARRSGTQTIRVNRIRGYWGRDSAWGKHLTGAILEGANHADFSDAEILARITEPIDISVKFYINSLKKYRYVRFVFRRNVLPDADPQVPRRMYGRLTEVEIGNDHGLLTGNVLCSPDLSLDNAGKAFDGDWYTSLLSITVKGNPTTDTWLGLDLGKQEQISHIEVAMFNEDAFVYRGYEHRLFYWDNGSWRLHDSRKADGRYLEFTGVPVGTLFCLKCADLELKERIFTYEDGEQVWW
ncbi:MAG: hypothetical protein LBQ60_12100 [Bacteroidales bacterium]|jgi:hypothetical protein|nr:hypothetical protein [Bacteroidales bacterium]